jgi:hypothetical protein
MKGPKLTRSPLIPPEPPAAAAANKDMLFIGLKISFLYFYVFFY